MEEFRHKPLQAEYQFIWVDALYNKVRCDRMAESAAIMIAHGVDVIRQKEVLAVEPYLFH